MAKEKIETLKKELEELSQQHKEVEAEDRERKEQEKLRLEKQQQEKLEASKKLKTEIEELRKAYLKEPEENLKKARELVEKLPNDVQLYERLYQESQERLSAIKRDSSDPMKSFLQTPEMELDPYNPLNPMTHSQIVTRVSLELASFDEYEKNLEKRAEETIKDIERYKEKLEASKVQLESAEKELLKIESELISRLESAEIAFAKDPEYLKLKAQLNEFETQKQELDTQKQELYSKMYERDLTTREKINKLEGERIEKEHQLKLQLEEARINLEKFKLELGKKLDFQKILAEEVSSATNDQEREELQQVQQSIEKKIKHLLDEISNYEQILTPQQEPSSSSSSSSDSSSSLSSSYSSSSSSSSESMSLKISPSSLSASGSSFSDSTASEMRSFSSSESPIILLLNSNSNSITSEEVSPAGEMDLAESDS